MKNTSNKKHGGKTGNQSSVDRDGKNKRTAPKGLFARWLDRLGKTNEKEFGSKGPCCH